MQLYDGKLTLTERRFDTAITTRLGTPLGELAVAVDLEQVPYVLVIGKENALAGIVSSAEVLDCLERRNPRERERWIEMPVEAVMLTMIDLCQAKDGGDFQLSDQVSLDCTPILDQNQLVGVINDDDLLISYRKIEQILRRAATDPITGLPTRSVFERRLREEWRRAQSTDESLAVILIDVDNFKTVNDRCGHMVGDAVLHMVGSCLRTSLRSYDMVARHGGDEFSAICFGCRPGEIDIPVGRLLDAIENLSIPADPGGNHMISLSIGAAVMDGGFADCQPMHLIETADRCLYRAKQNGRARAYRTEINGPELEPEIVRVLPSAAVTPV
jgi:diguanylate cyclase (GGDEF)-like protein